MPSNTDRLHRGDKALLLGVALIVNLLIMSLQPVPGYMDAAYYYSTGIQLAQGNGFSEPFIWNYLDQPQSIPHPSHSYWYPLASIVAAAGMALTGQLDFLSARILFLLAATLAPLAVASLSIRLSGKRNLALIAGFLCIFSGYYLPFIVTTDNYALYILIGAVYFILLDHLSSFNVFLLGILTGFLNLARGDGLLWLPLTLLVIIFVMIRKREWSQSGHVSIKPSVAVLIALVGYILVMGPWLIRNYNVFGSLTPPGTGYLFWMTSYSQIFSYTPENYTFASWLGSGWKEILSARLQALGQNLGTSLLAQGFILLSPLVILGGWKNRKNRIVCFGFLAWLFLLISESVFFPFASVRGGFFHAGAAFQSLWFVLVPIGLDTISEGVPKRISDYRLFKPFSLLLMTFALVVSGILVKIRVLDTGWNEGEYRYQQAEEIIIDHGAQPDDVVVTINPPAYYAMTMRNAIVLPSGSVSDLLAAVERYDANYVILERDRLRDPYIDLIDHPEKYPDFLEVGGFDEVTILFIDPSR